MGLSLLLPTCFLVSASNWISVYICRSAICTSLTEGPVCPILRLNVWNHDALNFQVYLLRRSDYSFFLSLLHLHRFLMRYGFVKSKTNNNNTSLNAINRASFVHYPVTNCNIYGVDAFASIRLQCNFISTFSNIRQKVRFPVTVIK